MDKIKDYIKKDWLFILNFIAWFIIYGNTSQVGLEALSGLMIFAITAKNLYELFTKK